MLGIVVEEVSVIGVRTANQQGGTRHHRARM